MTIFCRSNCNHSGRGSDRTPAFYPSNSTPPAPFYLKVDKPVAFDLNHPPYITLETMSSETTRLLQQLRSLDRSSPSDEDARVQMLTAARELCQRLETPFEWVQRMTWQEVSKRAVLAVLQLRRAIPRRGPVACCSMCSLAIGVCCSWGASDHSHACSNPFLGECQCI